MRLVSVRMSDGTFAYWKTGFAQSPAAEMVLKFDGREWHASAARMRRPMPGQATLVESRALWGQWREDDSGDWFGPDGEAPWGALLDLIYTGRADEARQLLDEAWVGDEAHKRQFWHELLQQLHESPAWAALLELNGPAIQGRSRGTFQACRVLQASPTTFPAPTPRGSLIASR